MATTEKKQPTEAQLRAREANAARLRRMHEERRSSQQAASRDVSETEVMVASLQGRTQNSVEDMAGAIGTTSEQVGMVGTITNRGPIKVRLYDSEGNMRYVRSSDLAMVLKNGLFPVCPICGSKHADNSINVCKGRDPVLFTRCDICARYGRNKLIADERLRPMSEALTDDPNYVVMDIAVGKTDRDRLRLRYQAHVRAYHANEATAMGLLNTRGDSL